MRLLLPPAIAVCALASAGTANADETRHYPGSACRPDAATDNVYYVNGGITNTSTSQAVFVYCPLFLDEVGSDDDVSVEVDVCDGVVASEQVECTLIQRELDGTFVGDDDDASDDGNDTLELFVDGGNDHDLFATLECVIPARPTGQSGTLCGDGSAKRSYINSYTVVEN